MSISSQLKHDTPYTWFLRYWSSSSPLFCCKHLAELDDRLDAYLDCYLISEREHDSLLADLSFDDWGSVFVTALIALRSNNKDALATAVDAVATEQQSKELSDAFCWVDFEVSKQHLQMLIHHKNPYVRIAAIESGSFFGGAFNSDALNQVLNNESPEVIAASLKLVGRNKLTKYSPVVEKYLMHKDDNIRFQAAYTANLLSLSGAISAIQPFCFKENTHLREALALLYQVVTAENIEPALTRIQQSTLSPRIKAYNIAMAGLPNWMPILLEWMKDPEYAPLAGEAFSFITGVDIEEDDLSIRHVELCEAQEAPLAEKRKQDPWTEYYEDDLPWPDPDLVKQWWTDNQSKFNAGTRYLAGKTLDTENLQIVLKEGTQPQRHLANIILSVKSPNRILKTVRGKQTRQIT